MTPCDHIRANGIALAALGEHDPERGDAFRHAQGCPGCARALEDGARLLAVLDVPAPPVSAELLERTRTRVLGGARTLRSVSSRLVLATAAGAGGAIVLALARSRAALGAPWIESLVVLAIAILVVALATSRGAAATMAAALVSAAFALFAGHAGPLEPAIGATCVALESLAAMVPLLAAAYLVRRHRVDPDATVFCGVAAAGALAGHAALHLTCPLRHSAVHLFAFHLSGVILAAVLGILLARLAGPRLAQGR